MKLQSDLLQLRQQLLSLPPHIGVVLRNNPVELKDQLGDILISNKQTLECAPQELLVRGTRFSQFFQRRYFLVKGLQLCFIRFWTRQLLGARRNERIRRRRCFAFFFLRMRYSKQPAAAAATKTPAPTSHHRRFPLGLGGWLIWRTESHRKIERDHSDRPSLPKKNKIRGGHSTRESQGIKSEFGKNLFCFLF